MTIETVEPDYVLHPKDVEGRELWDIYLHGELIASNMPSADACLNWIDDKENPVGIIKNFDPDNAAAFGFTVKNKVR